MFRTFLRIANAIGYEGQPYGPFISQLVRNERAEWLPNFVPAAITVRRPAQRDGAGPNLIYVGRLSREKGVIAAISAFRSLKELCPTATLTLIGAWAPSFKKSLDPTLLSLDGISVAGSLPAEEVLRSLDKADFFVFLSHYRGEGHSNALTEAMARGCVPVVTRHGFNEAVVTDAGLVIEDRDDSSRIASLVSDVWNKKDWLRLSHAASERVATRFSDEAVAGVLGRLYEKAATH